MARMDYDRVDTLLSLARRLHDLAAQLVTDGLTEEGEMVEKQAQRVCNRAFKLTEEGADSGGTKSPNK